MQNMLKSEHFLTCKMLSTILDRTMAKIIDMDHKTKKKVGTVDCCYLFCRRVTWTDQRWTKHH
jgi:hypothetical protein